MKFDPKNPAVIELYDEGRSMLQQLRDNGNYDLWRAMGFLPENPILTNMFDKLATQYFVSTFKYQNKIVNRYMKKSSEIGGVDELVAFGLAEWKKIDYNADWTKDRYYARQYRVWAPVEYPDRYLVTTQASQVAQAFVSIQAFGSAVGQMLESVVRTKSWIWYRRIRDLHKRYRHIVIIDDSKIDYTQPDAEEKAGILIGNKISEYMKRISVPSTQFNVAGIPSAWGFEQQQLVWNIKYNNMVQWASSRIFNPGMIDNLSKVLFSDYIDYEDDKIVGVLDTNESIYIGQKISTDAFFAIPAYLETNHYLHEVYTVAIVDFAPGIIFQLSSASSGQGALIPLNTVLTTTNLTIKSWTTELATQLADALAEANPTYEATDKEIITPQIIQGNKGTAIINALAGSKYIGDVILNFTIDGGEEGSSNIGQ